MRIKVLGALGAFVCAVALSACGGSSDSSSSTSSSSGDVTAFCDKVHELNQLSNPFASVKPGDVQGAKDALDKLNSEVASVAAVAPAAIKSDVEKVQQTMTDFANKLKSASTPAQVLQVAQGFQTEAASVQTTAAKLKKYTQQNCKNG